MPLEVTISGAGLKRGLGALAVLAVLAAAGYGVFDLVRARDPFGGRIDPKRFQAVILSNDRIYFGHLRSVSDEFYELREVFFIREAKAGERTVQQVAPLSEELQGPENRMLIRKDEVVLVENLREDSPVAKAIRERQRTP